MGIHKLRELGYKVPKDIKITGFDNIYLSSSITPSLTTIAIDWSEFGKKVAQYALDILKNKTTDKLLLISDAKIIKRESTK